MLTLTALINILYSTVDVIRRNFRLPMAGTKRQVNYTTRAKSARQIVACKRISTQSFWIYQGNQVCEKCTFDDLLFLKTNI